MKVVAKPESFNFYCLRIELIKDAYARGLRVDNLGEQPALWLLWGLEVLEAGGEVDEQGLRRIDESGGTDHPDPFF